MDSRRKGRIKTGLLASIMALILSSAGYLITGSIWDYIH